METRCSAESRELVGTTDPLGGRQIAADHQFKPAVVVFSA
jgi:hypothetical protein